MADRAKRRCNNCGCWVPGMWGDRFPKFDCALGEEIEPRHPCKPVRINLLEMALRRLLVPDAFDARLRIQPGRLMEVLAAEGEALRQVAALSGPVDHRILVPTPAGDQDG